MNKSDIICRYYDGKNRPVINVKCPFPLWQGVKAGDKAKEYAYNAAVTDFWEGAQMIAKEIWGEGAEVISAGRSGGWAYVDFDGFTRDEVDEHWSATDVAKWARFERELRQQIKYLATDEWANEIIESNRWDEDGAEEYNFRDNADGSTVCISEMKAKAKAAGFSAVIRG